MNLLRKLTLAAAAVVFCFGLFTVTASAQGRHRGWSNNGVYIQYGQPQWDRRRGRISPQEYRRLHRQRYRLYRSRNRAYQDGYVNYNERRRLSRQYYKYRRNVYRDRRDRN